MYCTMQVPWLAKFHIWPFGALFRGATPHVVVTKGLPNPTCGFGFGSDGIHKKGYPTPHVALAAVALRQGLSNPTGGFNSCFF